MVTFKCTRDRAIFAVGAMDGAASGTRIDLKLIVILLSTLDCSSIILYQVISACINMPGHSQEFASPLKK